MDSRVPRAKRALTTGCSGRSAARPAAEPKRSVTEFEWRFAIGLLEDFHRYLADHGVTLTELSRAESFAVTKRWTSVFAVQSENLRETQGLKAIGKWLNTGDDQLILLFLSAKITAFPISKNSRPCTAHRYNGPVIDLSAYNQLEFAVFPETYEWTLIHTHEDGAFGGPYFIRNEGTLSDT